MRAPSFNLADLFELVADAVPDRHAVVCGVRRLTYAQLRNRVEQVAGALDALGVVRGDRVALALRNGSEYLEMMLGAFWIGAVPVNVNYRYRETELAHVLTDSGATVLVHESDLDADLEVVAGKLAVDLVTVERGSRYETWLATATPPSPVDRSGDDRYLLYTGGTTGSPKGVLWRHEDIFFAAMGGGRRGGDPIQRPEDLLDELSDPPNRVLCASPLMHGTAHWFALLTLFAGSTVVLSESPTVDPAHLLDLVDAEGVSYLVLVGDAFARPMVEAIEAEPERWDLTSLTLVVSGGATLSAPIRRALCERLPWILVIDSYGTSETGGQASSVHSAGMAARPGLPRFELRDHTAVLDEHLRPVEAGSGTVGRVAKRGHVPLGYLDDAARSAQTFPVLDGVRWALTGDQATVDDDGMLVLLGRGSVTINSGGEKVHPEEVEAALVEHPAVLDAVVVGLPDQRWGERVAAVVAARPGAAVETGALAAHCRERIADFKVPREVVVVDQVRRSESGKPDHDWARSCFEGR